MALLRIAYQRIEEQGSRQEPAPRPSGYPHSRTENTHKIANGKAAINRGHPAVLIGCVRCERSLARLLLRARFVSRLVEFNRSGPQYAIARELALVHGCSSDGTPKRSYVVKVALHRSTECINQ